MKLKKLFAAAAAAALATVCATTALAAMVPAQRVVDEAVAFAAANGITVTGTDGLAALMNDPVDIDIAQARADAAAWVDAVKRDPSQTDEAAAALVAAYGPALGITGIDVQNIAVNKDGSISVTAAVDTPRGTLTVLGTTPGKPASAYDAHPDIAANKDANGDWHHAAVTAAGSAAAVVGSGTGGVIKATGSGAGTVLCAFAAAMAALLCAAARRQAA